MKSRLWILGFGLSVCGSLPAAVHLTYSVERQYFGQIQRMPDIEIWVTDSSLSWVWGRQKILYSRIDGNRTIFSSDGLRCFQSGIDEKVVTARLTSAECPVQYQQKFFWNVIARLPDDTLRNVPCSHLVIEGQDAYSEKRVDVWVAKDVPGFLKPFPALRASCRLFSDDGDMGFFDADPALASGVVFKQIDIVTPPNPVPDTYVVTMTLTRFEEAGAPDGLFGIPDGVKRVRTVEEL